MNKNIFGMDVKSTKIKKKDIPSGRLWTEKEKNEYYTNFKKDYNVWKNDVLKGLYENRMLEYKGYNTNADNAKLEEKLNTAFKNNVSVDDFVKSFKN